jgi:hypothetical protein
MSKTNFFFYHQNQLLLKGILHTLVKKTVALLMKDQYQRRVGEKIVTNCLNQHYMVLTIRSITINILAIKYICQFSTHSNF